MALLIREIDAAGVDEVFLSSETFSAVHNVDACSKVIRALNPSSSGVIVFLRRQDVWLDSFYRAILTWSGTRETRSIRDFFVAERSGQIDFTSRLHAWVNAVGAENVVVRSYDDAVAGAGVLPEMLECLGVRESSLPSISEERIINVSLDRSYADLLRGVNSLPDITNEEKTEVSRFLIGLEPTVPSQTPTSLIDEELWFKMKRAFSETNRSLCDSFMGARGAHFLFPDAWPGSRPAIQRLDFATASRLLSLVRTGGLRRSQ